MVKLEKRENSCPYARFYKYRSIGVPKVNKEAVKCLLKNNIHNTAHINLYCSRRYDACEIYKKEIKVEEFRSGKRDVVFGL